MRIHKRLIELVVYSLVTTSMGAMMLTIKSLNAPTEVVKQIIINIEAGVEVEVTIAA